jgi:hypothetical protein
VVPCHFYVPSEERRRRRAIHNKEQSSLKRIVRRVTHLGLSHRVLLTVFATMLRPTLAEAQSVIVGVPNTDVTAPKFLMIAHESQLNIGAFDRPYWNSFSFATYGIGHNIELAATLYGLSSPGSGNIAIAAGYKHRIPLVEHSDWQPTIAIGQMFPVSLSGTGLGFWTYGVSSLRLPLLKTRFTLGASYGSRQIFGRTSVSLLGGVEQPFSKAFSLVADYISGGNDLGALIPAVQLTPFHGFIIIAGVKFPNTPRAGPVSALLEITYDFELH